MENRTEQVTEILCAIENERQRQILKWGQCERRVENPQSDPFWKCAVLVEETGEVGKALVEGDQAGLRKELYHVAAVCVAWLESLDG